MPAFLRGADPDGGDDLVGMKWVAGFATNNAVGMPAINAVVVLNDAGDRVADRDPRRRADHGACARPPCPAWPSAGSRRRSPGGRHAPGSIGAGTQGHSHLAVLGHVLPGVSLTLFDRHPERAAALAEEAEATDGIGSVAVAADSQAAIRDETKEAVNHAKVREGADRRGGQQD